MSKIKNSTELRDDLLGAYEDLRKDPRRLNQVAELSNTAGKILASAKMEMEYQSLRGEMPEVPFLDNGIKRKPAIRMIGST